MARTPEGSVVVEDPETGNLELRTNAQVGLDESGVPRLLEPGTGYVVLNFLQTVEFWNDGAKTGVEEDPNGPKGVGRTVLKFLHPESTAPFQVVPGKTDS